MAEEKSPLREIQWTQVFPWLAIFRTFGVALDLKKLLLGGIGVLAMYTGWSILALVFTSVSNNPVLKSRADEVAHWPWESNQWHSFTVSRTPTAVELLDELEKSGLKITPETHAKLGALSLIEDLERSKVEVTPADRTAIEQAYGVKSGMATVDELLHNPVRALWQLGTNWRFVLKPGEDLMHPFRTVFSQGTGILPTVFALLCGLWGLLVWAYFGGAISRLAAVEFAREEKISLKESMQFARSRFMSYGGAPMILLGFLAVPFLLCMLGALIPGLVVWLFPGFAGARAVFIGVLWIFPLVFGFIMAIVMIVAAVAWPLMYSTISVEGSDSFDAISRSFSYVFQGVWRYLFYVLVALVYGSLCSYFVLLFSQLLIHTSQWAVAWGGRAGLSQQLAQLFLYAPEASGWRPTALVAEPTGATKFAAICMAGWLYFFFMLLVGFVHSYFWSASTVIYYLLRRDVDNTEIQEVFLEGEDGDNSFAHEPSPVSPVVETKDSASPGTG